MIASVSAISSLFFQGNDKEIAIKVAYTTYIVISTQNSVITALAADVALQFANDVPFDVERLLKAATTYRDMRSFIIHMLVIECPRSVHEIIQKETHFMQLLHNILSSDDGFVSVAGSHLLISLFNLIPSSIEVIEQFTSALHCVLEDQDQDQDPDQNQDQDQDQDLDRIESNLIEAMLLIMRQIRSKFCDKSSMSVSEGSLWSSDKRSTALNLSKVSEKVRDGLGAWTVWKRSG
jgi:hypothetical protein